MDVEFLPLMALAALGLALGTAALGHVVLRLLRLRGRSPFSVGLAGASIPALLSGLAACPLFTLPVLALLGMAGARVLRRAGRFRPFPRPPPP
ncbi:MAG: hypothetical protein HYY05_02755 [Chloroflexi bacterium]|nr:hypothetical protein [Chloroflexota bacterium]